MGLPEEQTPQPIAYSPPEGHPQVVVAYPPPPVGSYIVSGAQPQVYSYTPPPPGFQPYAVAPQAGEVQILPRPGVFTFDENEYSLHLQPFITKDALKDVLVQINTTIHSATKLPNLMTKLAVISLFLSTFSVIILSLSWIFLIYYWLLPTILWFGLIMFLFIMIFVLMFLRMWLTSSVNNAVASLQPYIDSLNHQYNGNGLRFKLTTESVFVGWSRRRANYRLVPKLIIEFNSTQQVVHA